MAPQKLDTSAQDAAPKSFSLMVRRALPPAPIPAPISTFLSPRTLVETIDNQLSQGVADMHLRTTIILNRTCHPPTSPLPLHVQPIFLPFVTIATSSAPTDMTLYAIEYDIDMDTFYDPLHSYFHHSTAATWDALSTAPPPSLSNLPGDLASIPIQWTRHLLTPIHKHSKDKFDPHNYRGLGLASAQ